MQASDVLLLNASADDSVAVLSLLAAGGPNARRVRVLTALPELTHADQANVAAVVICAGDDGTQLKAALEEIATWRHPAPVIAVGPADCDFAAEFILAGGDSYLARHDGLTSASLSLAIATAQARRNQRLAAASLSSAPADLTVAAILDELPAMIGYWDRELRNRLANRAYRDWFGWSPERMRGCHIREVLGEELFVRNWPYMERALAGESVHFEREIQTPTGLRFSSAAYIPHCEGGQVRGFFVHVSDVTQIKQLEKASRHSEERLRAVTEACPLGILAHDMGLVQTYASERCVEITGHRGPMVWGTIADSDRRRVQELLDAALAASGPYDFECRFSHPDGRLVWARALGAQVRDGDRVTGYVATLEDVTAQRATQALNRRLLEILERTPDMVGMQTRDGQVVYLNAAARNLLGLTDGDLKGPLARQALKDRVYDTEEQHLASDRLRSQALREGESKGEVTARGVSGALLVDQTTFAHYDDGGEVEFLSTVSRDITAARRAERELHTLAAQQRDMIDAAQASSRAKSQFLANMSHEIRTPMNGVLGLTELLLEMALPEDAVRKLRTIHTSGRTLLTVINDVLDFSKLEQERVVLEVRGFDLAQRITEVVGLFESEAARKSIVLTIDIAPGAPTFARADPQRFRQVLANLVSNALKFTHSGRIVVRLESAEGEGARVSVVDTGIGIDQATVPKLFVPFVQADSSIAREYGGTGLGLAICRKLVELWGGEIGCESVRGQGTTFWFTIPDATTAMNPVVAAPASSAQDPAAQVRARLSLRILVAEDNSVNREVIGGMLQALGCEAVIVEDGLLALQALETATYDVVLLDLHMPHMDGLQTARTIHSRFGEARPRLVALTADVVEERRQAFMEAGLDDFLPKPLRMAALREALGRCQRAT